MNVNIITREYNSSTGVYGANITQEELEAARAGSNLLDEAFYQRATGLNLLVMKNHETPNYNTSAGFINTYFNRDDDQPGNGHFQIATTASNTWDHATANAMNLSQEGQLAGEILQAKSFVGDYNDMIGDLFYLYGLHREDDFFVNMTYSAGNGL